MTDPSPPPVPRVSRRAASIDVSGIRRAFELGAALPDPINLSIGQPDFPVPEAIQAAAIDSIRAGRNGYSLTQGTPELLASVRAHINADLGWDPESHGHSIMVTSGTSGALLLAAMAVLDPDDEVVIPDPYFVIYPALASMIGARAVRCDTYPDFRMTAARVEPLITGRTRMVMVNSPANPTGVVLTGSELAELAGLCESRGVLLVSDEIYDGFTFPEAREGGRCPSPGRSGRTSLLIRGFGKTYGCTGWRLGYAVGPAAIIREMLKLQQYTFVCAPTPLQVGAAQAFGVDMEPTIARYAQRRDAVCQALGGLSPIVRPCGAFYAFVEVPPRLGISATEFARRAASQRVIVIPGSVFSHRDTHFRLSFAVDEQRLQRGLQILAELLGGG